MGCGCVFMLVGLAAVIATFKDPWLGWAILAVPSILLSITLWALKAKKWRHIPELSAAANRMLQNYGHFYTMPFAARDFSSAASGIQIAGWINAAIGLFDGFWWGLVPAIANGVFMGYVAKSINPSVFISDPLEQLAHDEVIAFITQPEELRDIQRSERDSTLDVRRESQPLAGGQLYCPRCGVPRKYASLLDFPRNDSEALARTIAPVITDSHGLARKIVSLRKLFGELDSIDVAQLGLLYCSKCYVTDLGTVCPLPTSVEAVPESFVDIVCGLEEAFTIELLGVSR